MITPFGRYMLPFDLKVSSEIFQRKTDEVLGDLDGVFNIVDNLVIVGCGNSDAEVQSDDQQKLAVTLKRCAEKNIILNEDKQETDLDEINHEKQCESRLDFSHFPGPVFDPPRRETAGAVTC